MGINLVRQTIKSIDHIIQKPLNIGMLNKSLNKVRIDIPKPRVIKYIASVLPERFK